MQYTKSFNKTRFKKTKSDANELQRDTKRQNDVSLLVQVPVVRGGGVPFICLCPFSQNVSMARPECYLPTQTHSILTSDLENEFQSSIEHH